MGNSKSNTVKIKNEDVPIKSAIKKTPTPAPVNGYQPGPVNGYESGPTNEYESGPVNGYQPGPVNGYQPDPVNGHQPSPVNRYQNGPVNWYQPDPVNGYQPGPIHGYQYGPVNGYQPGPVNGYNYYPASYIPEQHAYPMYPANYPVVSSEKYFQKEIYPQSQTKTEVLEQRIPTHHHHSRSHHSDRHHHHQHTSHAHHHHHHHHHPPAISPEKGRVGPPTVEEHTTSSRRPRPSPSVQTQKPASSIVLYKIESPVTNKELETRPARSVHYSPSVAANKPSSPVIIQQYQPSPPLLTASKSFEKAPVIEISRVVQSPDSHSIHSYGPGTLTIERRTPSQNTTPGNRWYDHEYDKRIKSLTVNEV